MNDPRVHRIFETTGPLVKNERFKLMEMTRSSLLKKP